MSKLRACYNNLAFAASGVTFAASASATGYAPTNLANPKRGLPWRSSTTTGNQTQTTTFITAKTLYAIFLVSPKGHTGGTILVETKNGGGAYSAFGGGTGLVALSTSGRTRLTGLWNTGGTAATDIRITFTNTGAVSEYVELGVLVAVDATGYFAATVNVTDAYAYQPVDLSELSMSVGGQEQAWTKGKILTFENEFQYMPIAQTTALWSVHDAMGITGPVVLAIDPDNLDEIAYGRFTRFEPRHLTRDQWALGLGFREAA